MDQQSIDLLKGELSPNLALLVKATDTIKDEQISNYPLIVLSKQLVELGIPIFGSQKIGSFHYSASTLEELASKKIIQLEKVDDFRQIYKEHSNQICLFVIDEKGGQFIFLPITNQT